MPKAKKPSKDPADKQESRPKFPSFPNRVKEMLNSENAPAYYTNSVQIASSIWDFRLGCGEVVEGSPEKIVIKHLCSIYMSPNHAKAVSILLSKKIKEYEDQFGEVPVPPL